MMNKLIKLICVKTTKNYDIAIEIGDIVYSYSYYEPYAENIIAIFFNIKETSFKIGYFEVGNFLPFEKYREQQIDKILNDG